MSLKAKREGLLPAFFDFLDTDDPLFFSHEVKDAIHTFEREQGWRREKAERNVYEIYLERFSDYIAQRTSSKLIVPKKKTKVVDHHIPGLYPETEILRHLLEADLLRFGKKRIPYRVSFQDANKLYFPYKFQTGRFNSYYVKIDVKRCFYTIYSRLGVDCIVIADIDHEKKEIVLHACGRGVVTAENSNLIRSLKERKSLRNSVYGLTRCAFSLFLYPDGKRKRQYIRTSLQNLDLTVAIASILHALVYPHWDKIIYWNIDGGIVRVENVWEIIQTFQEHGFEVEIVAEGEEVEVKGLGSYRIGEYKTLHFEHNVQGHIPFKENIYHVKNVEKVLRWLKGVKK